VKPVSGPDLCRLLAKNGWTLSRISGSHHIYSKSGFHKIISVPVHSNQMIKPGLAARIARDAGIKW
jgi:predicted RNA binding protein YcfA (HicA-like mRNA interferase family)